MSAPWAYQCWCSWEFSLLLCRASSSVQRFPVKIQFIVQRRSYLSCPVRPGHLWKSKKKERNLSNISHEPVFTVIDRLCRSRPSWAITPPYQKASFDILISKKSVVSAVLSYKYNRAGGIKATVFVGGEKKTSYVFRLSWNLVLTLGIAAGLMNDLVQSNRRLVFLLIKSLKSWGVCECVWRWTSVSGSMKYHKAFHTGCPFPLGGIQSKVPEQFACFSFSRIGTWKVPSLFMAQCAL